MPILHGSTSLKPRLFKYLPPIRVWHFGCNYPPGMFWWWTGILIALGIVLLFAAMLSAHGRRHRIGAATERYRGEFARALSDARQKRAERELERALAKDIVLRPLLPEDKERCRREWRDTQARFSIDPARAVVEAGRLVEEIARLRGREEIAVDIAARRIAWRGKRGQATLEELRAAMALYSAVIEDLLANGLRATGS